VLSGRAANTTLGVVTGFAVRFAFSLGIFFVY
jgi:hypothetical protein